MPEDIERLIYKLELDGSAYIQGVEALSASTKKLTAEQEKANQALKTSEANLKAQSAYFNLAKKDLDNYTGTNEKYRQQLTKSFTTAEADNKKLTAIVDTNRKAYEQAAKAAQDFANVTAKANNLQPVQGQGKIPTGSTAPTSITSQIAGVLNVADFAKQAQIIEQTKNEFNDLAVSVALAEARMKQLNATDEEFQQLAPIVEKGKEALDLYAKATQGAGQSSGTLQSQIRKGKEELVKLQSAGLGATKQYRDLELQVAKLSDEFGDQQARIKTLASDTKLLDFGKASITAATSAFQAYTAVSILAGDESEEMQKKTQQLFAAMQLLQSLEQLSNLTRREGALATLAQSGAQTLYTAVVGASTGALKAFRLALAATGIGAAIVLIGILVSKFLAYRDSVKKAGEQQQLLSDIIKEGNQNAAKQITDLRLLYQAATDANIPMEKRLDAAKNLNKEFPETFKNFSAEEIALGKAKAGYDALAKSIQAAAVAEAAKGKIQALVSEQLDIEAEDQKVRIATANELAANRKSGGARISSNTGGVGGGATSADVILSQQDNERLIVLRRDQKRATLASDKQKIQDRIDFLIKFAGLENFVPKPPPDGKKDTKKEIENVYLAEKEKLDLRLAELNRKEADNESKIRIEYAARLTKEQSEIDKLLRAKKLTGPQAFDLKEELKNINSTELTKALADFHKKQTDARTKLNDELKALQDKNTLDTLNLIQDDFDRRAALINFNEERELEQARENTAKKLEALDFQRLLIGEQAYQDARNTLIAQGNEAAINLELRFAQERKDLAADIYKKALDFYKDFIFQSDLLRDEDEAKEIAGFADKFIKGQISYTNYHKAITDIEKNYAKRRRDATLLNDQNELRDLENQIATSIDKTTKEYDELIRLRDEFRKKIAGEIVANKKADAEDKNIKDPETETKLDKFARYAEAVGGLTDQIISFWAKANEAESASLDRSIALQEKRVDAAQRIADRGNAQYLKLEQDRLTQLNVQKENAARKQLGINAALQGSEILVALISGIAQGVKTGAGPLGAIAAVGAIVAAIAGAFAIAQSLKPPVYTFFTGTKDTGRGGNEDNKGGFTATLHPNEAVIPAHRNKAYKDTVGAIYDGTIPAEHLNNFVKNYHRIKSVPQPNYQRIKEAAELKINSDGSMAVLLSEQNKKLDENNSLHRQTLRYLKNMGVNVNLDKNGFAVTQMEVMEQLILSKNK